MQSSSAKALQDALQQQGIKCLRVRADGNYVPRPKDFIVTWGNSEIPMWNDHLLDNASLNYTEMGVDIACNKLSTFNKLKEKGVSIPEFTTDPEEATRWQQTEAVVGRRVLNGHSGQGIYLFEAGAPLGGGILPGYPLYVKYVKKKAEYRVHVFNGEIIDVQQKRKSKEFAREINTKIRSHDNGWVFCREGVDPPESCKVESIKAVQSLGLDFGAVDIIWNEHQQKAFVLEVNTAPGLDGLTIQIYVDAIKKVFNNGN